MIKKKFFVLLLPLALIPMLYVYRRAECLKLWNLMKTNSYKLLQRNEGFYSMIGRNTTLSLRNMNLKNTIFTTTPKYSRLKSKESIKFGLKQKTQSSSKFLNQSVRLKEQRFKKSKPAVPQDVYNLTMGPTSAYYNKIPLKWTGKNLTNDITVVSVYIRLPPFPKGSLQTIRTPGAYEKWMKAFRWIINPVVIYTDDEKTYTSLTTMFQKRNKTSVKLILIRRESLWSFKQLPIITKILHQKNYPVHYPNTVISAYNCMTHAKFEILKKGIERNWFHTKYFIWLDIGYFRDPVVNEFGLDLPEDFDERRVAAAVVDKLVKGVSLESAVRGNKNWIAGGCFLGRFDVLHTFCNEYLAFVKKGIKEKMVGVEQQMMYAMYSCKKEPKTSLQLCSPGWFCMGRLAVQAWSNKQKKLRS